MYLCPSCEKEITYLKFSVAVESYDYGTADLPNRKLKSGESLNFIIDYNTDDSGDSNWNGNPEHECPHCENNIRLSELVWIEPEEKEEIIEKEKPKPTPPEPEETLHKIIKPEIILNIETESGFRNQNQDQTKIIMICKHCFYSFMYELKKKDNMFPEEESYECPRCSQTTTGKEYYNLLQKGFFKRKRKIINLKTPDVKKNTSRSITSLDKPRKSIHSKIFRSLRAKKNKISR